jgi:ribose/xylose/arabinose/galactoside ABC-type transport system permease subunit
MRLTRRDFLSPVAMLLVPMCFPNSITLPRFLEPYNLLDVTTSFNETALIALPMALLKIVAGLLLLVTIAVPRLLHGRKLEAFS